MSPNNATASGKLFLCGEYSVLLGHSALVLAIDRKAFSQYSPAPCHEFWSDTGKNRLCAPDHRLFTSAINACRRAGFIEKPGKYLIDTSHFFDSETNNKLGLGSSAAAIVSLCKLITGQTRPLKLHELFLIAQDANLEFSHGLASCADIAAACYNHAIHFQKSATGQPHIQTMDLKWLWPNLAFIYTKQSQDTRDCVANFLSFAKLNPALIEPFLHHSDKICRTFMGPPIHFAQQKVVIEEANALLQNLGQQCGLNIVSPPHQQISSIANKFGGSAKPSGAGGGDISIAVIEEKRRAEFMVEILQNGFGILNLQPNENT